MIGKRRRVAAAATWSPPSIDVAFAFMLKATHQCKIPVNRGRQPLMTSRSTATQIQRLTSMYGRPPKTQKSPARAASMQRGGTNGRPEILGKSSFEEFASRVSKVPAARTVRAKP